MYNANNKMLCLVTMWGIEEFRDWGLPAITSRSGEAGADCEDVDNLFEKPNAKAAF